MSGFFAAINLDGERFSRDLAERMYAQIQRFGSDSQRLLVEDNVALGFCAHWSTPEELNERQPLFDEASSTWCLFDGRIDNREELFSSINLKNNASVSDANLMLMLFCAHGSRFLKEVIGPFVCVFYSLNENRVIAARDCMGGRYLVFRQIGSCFLVATYEMALAAYPEIGYTINIRKAAKLLANEMDAQPESLLEGMSPLLPGQLLEYSVTKKSKSFFYLPDPSARIRMSDNNEYAYEFKRLLERAVERRLRSVGPAGSMLSGGLDSVPLSIAAAQILDGSNSELRSYSWVFDQFPSADEREYSEDVCQDWKIRPSWINCDDVWPQFDAKTAVNPIVPFSTPYLAFTQALFQQAQSDGTKVLLSGMGGDMLYSGTEHLLMELLFQRRWEDFWRESRSALSVFGSTRTFLNRYFLGGVRRNSRRRVKTPQWLNTKVVPWIEGNESWLASSQTKALRPQQYFNVIGTLEGEDAAYGRYVEAEYGLERRYPFRDRELAEFMLRVPTEQLFYKQTSRPIVRKAFEKQMRAKLLERKSKTNFSEVILAGIKADNRYLNWFEAEPSSWGEIVNKSYMALNHDNIDDKSLLQWRCAYYEFWKTLCYNFNAQGLGYLDE